MQTTLHNHYYGHDLPLGVKLTVQDRLATVAPDWPESPAAVALRDVQQTHAASLPDDSGELFAALLAMSQDALVNLLAVCLAPTVDVVTLRAANADPGAELAQAVGLNMAAWWKPTAEGYFRHVSKAGVLDAAKTFAPSEVNRLAKLKKGDLATEAERLAATVGWMPAVFAQNGAPDNHPEDTGPDAAVGEDADTDDADEADVSDVPPHLPMAA